MPVGALRHAGRAGLEQRRYFDRAGVSPVAGARLKPQAKDFGDA
jgi:hypothetical protein